MFACVGTQDFGDTPGKYDPVGTRSWRSPHGELPSESAAGLAVGRIVRLHRDSCTWLSICKRFCERGRSVGRSGRRFWACRWLVATASNARQPLGSVRSCHGLSPDLRREPECHLSPGTSHDRGLPRAAPVSEPDAGAVPGTVVMTTSNLWRAATRRRAFSFRWACSAPPARAELAKHWPPNAEGSSPQSPVDRHRRVPPRSAPRHPTSAVGTVPFERCSGGNTMFGHRWSRYARIPQED